MPGKPSAKRAFCLIAGDDGPYGGALLAGRGRRRARLCRASYDELKRRIPPALRNSCSPSASKLPGTNARGEQNSRYAAHNGVCD
jgi:hypothetical protein